MATRGRPRPVTRASGGGEGQPAATTTTPGRPSLAPAMTYSFAQQMPRLPSRPTPPPTASPEDPNFPTLTPPSRAWQSSVSAPSPGKWRSTPGKPTTAAEVVASMPTECRPDDDHHSESAKHEAELALYSKLVPTTSAVPRNPGSSLGGGGLRATGSVAAQKAKALQAPQARPAVSRKEPISSGMQSISSLASKTQLARRVAKPSRTPSATPPPATVPTDAPAAFAEAAATDVSDSTKAPTASGLRRREGQLDSKDAFLKNIVAVYGEVEKKSLRPAVRPDPAIASSQRSGSEDGPASRPRSSQPSSTRRLDQAFNSNGRLENGRALSPVPARQHQIGALRRSSGPSPPPGISIERKNGLREGAGTPVKNGKSTRKDVPVSSAADVPPGFETRTASISKAGFMTRPRGEGRGPRNPKAAADGDVSRTRPQNDRASAFREAIDTRRQSGPGKSAASRRNSSADIGDESSRGSSGAAMRSGPERDGSRRRGGAKAARPTYPPRRAPTGNGTSNPTSVKTRGRSDRSSAGGKREDKVFERRLERPMAEMLEQEARLLGMQPQSHDACSTVEQISTQGSVELQEDDVVEGPRQENEEEDVVVASFPLQQDYGYQSRSMSTSLQTQQPMVGSDFDFGRSNGTAAQKDDVFGHELNQWEEETNGVEEQAANAEAFVENLLSHEDEEYAPSRPQVAERPAAVPANGISLIDLMRELQASTAARPMWGSSSPEEVQRAPLPPSLSSGGQGGFEGVLRGLGWRAVDESEQSSQVHSRGLHPALQQGSSGVLHPSELSNMEVRPSVQNGENGNVRRSYYSHFQ